MPRDRDDMPALDTPLQLHHILQMIYNCHDYVVFIMDVLRIVPPLDTLIDFIMLGRTG